jgi:hypothetical protein
MAAAPTVGILLGCLAITKRDHKKKIVVGKRDGI